MARTIKQPYRKSRRFDKTCRNHGACSYCRSNRLHSSKRGLASTVFNLIEEEGLDTPKLDPGLELDILSSEIEDANDIDAARERYWTH